MNKPLANTNAQSLPDLAGKNARATEPLEPVPLSALQHYSYCPRQCALIHIEQVWDSNVLTVKGDLAHDKAHNAGPELRGGVRTERGITLWCERLGLSGKSDVVEFHPDGSVYPVEYKHGKRHMQRHDDLQLCGQALCLEEMLGIAIPRGAIWHHSSRVRREVEFTPALRGEVERIAAAVRALFAQSALPPPVADKRCRNCSLVDICLSHALNTGGWDAHWKELFRP